MQEHEVKSGRSSLGLVLEGRMGQAYTEEVFRYFLGIERKRAAQARRRLLLLLVSLKKRPGMNGSIPPDIANEIFSALWLNVREVDFVGWFRKDRVAGALLTQGRVFPSPDTCRRIAQRVNVTVSGRVPSDVASRLEVRVRQLRSPQNG